LKSLLLLWKTVAEELATRCCTSASLDFKTVKDRSKKEGKPFLTITLPNLGKAIELSLDQGFADRRLYTQFRCKGELPLFLGGFLDRIFDRNTGWLLDEPCVDAILAVRQLTLMFGKIKEPCSDARTRRAMRDFIECDSDVRESEVQWIDQKDQFTELSDVLFRSLFTSLDRKVVRGEIIPKHGPGATADRLVANEKFMQNSWTSRLEEVFPFGEYLFPSFSYWEQFENVDVREPGAEIPVRVIPVPKTAKTPRIIAIEPTCMQYVQQGLLEVINAGIRANTLERKTNHLRFLICSDDQEPNRVLAKEGSEFQNLATLDLSEASDRVSARLVHAMLRNHPHLRKAVFACRSTRADVPSNNGCETIELAKFASMGSGLCFPIEAMVFLTCVFHGIQSDLSHPLTQRDIKSYLGRVRVYGDDIIVPVEHVRSVIRSLEFFGAKVNRGKSFWTGKFRESCGKEYYDGHDVSICRVRSGIPSSLKNVAEITSTVSLRNHFYRSGYWSTARWLDSLLSRILKHYPVVADESPVLGRYSFLGYETQRICGVLHRPLVKGYVESASSPPNVLDDYGALLKFHLKRGREPSEDGHLERSGRPHAVNIKLRWCVPY